MTTTLTDEDLAAVLARYPLTKAQVLASFEVSKRNDNFLVEDSTRAYYVLRRYRRNPDEARIRFQLRFQRELFDLGLPTSDVMRTADGGLLVMNESGPWVLFSFVQGEEYNFERPAQAAEAGRRLAEFHNVSDGIGLPEIRVAHNPDVRRWWTRGDAEIAALAELFAGADIEAELSFLREWQERLVREWPLERLDTLPVGWVHGDYHGRNTVFDGDELVGLFDFDVVYRGYWVEDIALGLFMFGREFRGSTHIRPDVAELFLQGYEERRRLTDVEREALPMMAALTWSPSAPYHAMLERDGEDTVAYFRRFVELMRVLEGEMDSLALRLAGLPLETGPADEEPPDFLPEADAAAEEPSDFAAQDAAAEVPLDEGASDAPVSEDVSDIPVSEDTPGVPLSDDAPEVPPSEDTSDVPLSEEVPPSEDTPDVPLTADAPEAPLSSRYADVPLATTPVDDDYPPDLLPDD